MTEIGSINDHPAVAAARERRLAAEGALQDARERQDSAEHALSDAEQRAAEGVLNGEPVPDIGFARSTVTDTENSVCVAQDAISLANEREREATTSARNELLRELEREHAQAIDKLDRALGRAAKANTEVVAIQERAAELGIHLEPAHWPELLPESATNDTRLAQWRRHVEATFNN